MALDEDFVLIINDDDRDPTALTDAENAVRKAIDSLKKADREEVLKKNGYTSYVKQMQIRLRLLLEALNERNKALPLDPLNKENQDMYVAIQLWAEEVNAYATDEFVSNVKKWWCWKSTIQQKLSEFCNGLACYEADLRSSLKHEHDEQGQIRKLEDEVEANRKKIKEYEEQIQKYEQEKELHHNQIQHLQKQIKQSEEKNKELELQLEQTRRSMGIMEQKFNAESAKTDDKLRQFEDKIAQFEKMLNQAHPSM